MMTKFIGGARKTQMCCFSPCFPLSYPQFAVRLGSPEMLSRKYGTVCQGVCLCGLIACIGSGWHWIGMPTRVSSYPDWPLGLWRALNSDSLFILHTGSFIATHGRLMEVVRLTKVVSEGAPSHHCISLETHCDSWGTATPQSVLMLLRLLAVFGLILLWADDVWRWGVCSPVVLLF